jgi:trans-2,3-dihydro-3-hydroxyanthranilate isomerase
VNVVHTTVFADGPGGGNPCPVVFDAEDWDTERMRRTAEEFGHETAFVLPPQAGGEVRLRYFVPHHEMEMCVHATVAATVLLARVGRLALNPSPVETPLGIRHVTWDTADGTATVEQFPPIFGPDITDLDGVRAALRLPVTALGPVRSVSTARPKLMVPVRDQEILDGLSPDFELLWTVCDELHVTGCYPFTRDGDEIAARQFPLRAGYPEDPATGVAACALGAYLADPRTDGWQRFSISQGRAMGRPSRIVAEALVVDGQVTETRVGGGMHED